MEKDKMRKIKRIFSSYKTNLLRLRQLIPPSIQGVAYDKVVVQTTKSNNANEQSIIVYLIQKEELEREIELVNKVYEYFADERDEELAHLIDVRFRQGKKHWQSANACYISDRQGIRWLERAYEKAEDIGRELHIL
jgi:hypothetical protein